jgi:hypothetical protein
LLRIAARWEKSRVLTPKFTKLYQSYAQELQAEINEDVMSVMDDVELCDMHRFGKARVAREKELRDPDDVFIHAEERRKELAKQGKTPRVLKSARKRAPMRRNPSRPRRKKPIFLGG